MRSRSRSIRTKLVLLLLVPLLSLTALWGFGASITLGPGLSLLDVGTLVDFAKTSDGLSGALQAERRAAAVQAAKPGEASLRAFTAAREKTDETGSAYFAKADGDDVRSAIEPQAANDIDAYRAAIENLRTIRGQVTAGHGTVSGVLEVYTTALTASYTVTGSTIITFGDSDFAGQSRDVLDLARARDALSQEDAVMAAMLARGGTMNAPEHARFAEKMGVQRYQYAQAVPNLSPMLRSRYAAIVASPEYQRMRSMENRVTGRVRLGKPLPINANQWRSATSSVLKDQQKTLLVGADQLTAQGKPIAIRILGQLAATAVFGLIAAGGIGAVGGPAWLGGGTVPAMAGWVLLGGGLGLAWGTGLCAAPTPAGATGALLAVQLLFPAIGAGFLLYGSVLLRGIIGATRAGPVDAATFTGVMASGTRLWTPIAGGVVLVTAVGAMLAARRAGAAVPEQRVRHAAEPAPVSR